MTKKLFIPHKLTIGLLLILCLLSSSYIISNAAQPYPASVLGTYDLNIGGTQTFRFEDSNNRLYIITISEDLTQTRLDNKTYSISYEAPLSWKAGYKVNIKNNSIVSVHSAWHKPIRGKILSPVLKKQNSKQASYQFLYTYLTSVNSTGVCSSISGTTMKVYAI